MEREQAINYMRDLLKVIVEKKGSDLFVTVDFPPAIKIDGKIVPVSKTKLTSNNTKALAYAIMNDKQVKEFEATKESNFAISPGGIGRFRCNAFVRMGYTGKKPKSRAWIN
ncbi:MAG: Twitching mobility protein [Chromatiales bacterium USCg_Taylor]|nr:MAG: Twitching mobility protein [Chromatiales bacterium USCg_Taylor]